MDKRSGINCSTMYGFQPLRFINELRDSEEKAKKFPIRYFFKHCKSLLLWSKSFLGVTTPFDTLRAYGRAFRYIFLMPKKDATAIPNAGVPANCVLYNRYYLLMAARSRFLKSSIDRKDQDLINISTR